MRQTYLKKEGLRVKACSKSIVERLCLSCTPWSSEKYNSVNGTLYIQFSLTKMINSLGLKGKKFLIQIKAPIIKHD